MRMSKEIKNTPRFSYREWDGHKMRYFQLGQQVRTGIYGLSDDLKIMQFTGVYDHKGTPIFEGDILREVTYDTQDNKGVQVNLCKVVWCEFNCGFKLSDEMNTWDIWEDMDVHTYEIVSHVYASPVLEELIT